MQNFNTTKPFTFMRQKNNDMYVGSLTVGELKRIGFVDFYKPDVLDESPEQGYQRDLNEKRVKDASKYIRLNPNASFGCISLNARNGSLSVNEDNTLSLREQSCAIMDGQHRIAGCYHAANIDPQYLDMEISVIIYDTLGMQSERQLFHDFNKFQKGVPTVLCKTLNNIQNLNKSMENLTSVERSSRILKQVFDIVNNDENSVWYHKIFSPNQTVPKKNHSRKQSEANRNDKILSLGMWYESLHSTYSTLYRMEDFSNKSEERQVRYFTKMINTFWNVIKELTDGNDLFVEPYKYSIMASKGVRQLHDVLKLSLVYAAQYDVENIDEDLFRGLLGQIDHFKTPESWLIMGNEKGILTTSEDRKTSFRELIKGTTYETLISMG